MDSWPWAWTGWVGFWFPMGRGGVVLNLENPILKIFSLRICNFRLKGHIVRMGQILKNPSYTSCYQHSYQRYELIFEPLRCSVSKRVVFKDFRVFGAWKFFGFSLTFRGLTISLGSVLMLQKCHQRMNEVKIYVIKLHCIYCWYKIYKLGDFFRVGFVPCGICSCGIYSWGIFSCGICSWGIFS